jgi:hypothetical protein
MKILLEYFNAKVGRKDISETMTGNGSLHKTSNETRYPDISMVFLSPSRQMPGMNSKPTFH